MSSQNIQDICLQSRKAAMKLAVASGEARAEGLLAMIRSLDSIKKELQFANAADIEDAHKKQIPGPMLKRLKITDKVFSYMKKRLEEVSVSPDPLGNVLEGFVRPNGLRVERISVPIGVIGIIYESRPNVTTDAASVCLKSGNAVILRGGSESLRTNCILADAMRRGIEASGLPTDCVQIIRTSDRSAVGELLKQDQTVDVIIPRGGKSLIKRISEESRIPVIKHYDGICHQYIAGDATTEVAVQVVVNSKCQRVEVCNALETLLIDKACANEILPVLTDALRSKGVEIKGCPQTRQIIQNCQIAVVDDWSTEYLAPILSIKIVKGVNEAIEHINSYGSGHTDGIITECMNTADIFIASVDSGSVLVNASTRLSGGGDYGLGAVVGISTDKLHARGPVGPRELTSYKWVAWGKGHLRS